MFIREGAKTKLLLGERELFINEQWPSVVATIRRLGLDMEDLIQQAEAQLSGDDGEGEQ
jgi:hypothetical protein